MANRTQLRAALQKPYDRILFGKEVLSPLFGSGFTLNVAAVPSSEQPNKSEQAVIQSVAIYGNITLEDNTEIICYEIVLQPTVRIEHNKVAIQRYVRKLLTAGQAALINFVAPQNKQVWRLTLVAKDSELTEQGIREKTTHAKRYTYLLGPSETCKTAAERFEALSISKEITFQSLITAFSVDKLSKAFFDEYTLHYRQFCEYLQASGFRKSAFKISFPADATNEEIDKACKPIRDFVKKLLGRIVFLYFVQKKGWLGATDTQYGDGPNDFIKRLFNQAGSGDDFYAHWLRQLFFETLNQSRANDNFKMPDGTMVKVPFLNGGLFDKEAYDEALITVPAGLFHHADFEEVILTPKNAGNARGFLDFLDAFNFTVHEDSPEDQTVAVDPEMLGHIFENLLEDNKDKGAFYTPKEIVHYMCQESLIEYLATHLSKEYSVYREIGNAQVELFGNDTRTGQLKMMEALGDKALDRAAVEVIVKQKDISRLTKAQLSRIDQLLDSVKICDPAIGSGAFPMGLLQEIHSIKEVIAFELGQEWMPADVKENIIQHSIYGVDIEKGAVDIARLRFWLSLVVDEEKPRALPNLDYKIVVGNSLLSKFEGEVIEIDWERRQQTASSKALVEKIQRLLKEIAAQQKAFFHSEKQNKKLLSLAIRQLKLELLHAQLTINMDRFATGTPIKGGFEPTAADRKFNEWRLIVIEQYKSQLAKVNKLLAHPDAAFDHFDWRLDFPEVLNPHLVGNEGGFDIFIGNPPYIQLAKLKDQALANAGYKTFEKNGDIYCLFYELGIEMLRQNGLLTYITSNSWLQTQYGRELRKYFIEKADPIALLNFTDAQLFETAIVEANIILLKKATYQKHLTAAIVDNRYKPNGSISSFVSLFGHTVKELSPDGWSIGDEKGGELKAKMEAQGRMLKNWDIRIDYGIKTGLNEAFVISGETKDKLIQADPKNAELIKPTLRGRDLRRYSYQFSDYWMVFSHNGLKAKKIPRIDVKGDYPSLFKYFEGFLPQIEARTDQGDHWSNLRNCAYIELFEQPKIIWGELSDKAKFTFDDTGHYVEATTFFLTGTVSLRYLLAIFNSKAAQWYFEKISTTSGMGTNRWKKYKIELLPVPVPDKKAEEKIEQLVNLVLSARKGNGDSSALEKEIDVLVFKLYNLTYPEVKLIDPDFWLVEEEYENFKLN